ncbi:hypothetical protein [Pseudomonas sp. UBA2684]|uniref:hypothetical protein n=1 Tax=Pseudomonas sp. UBA2684 TaxID=1947311 RepID=UPI0025EC648A|nr:hypothetical protein [Pseudomonas sp. UBA2684]
MNPQLHAYPYRDRYLSTDSGVALIWPFANVMRGEGPYELFLDTNALTKTQWVGQLPPQVRERAILNPWPALMEQWLSNPMFRKEPSSRIDEMTARLAKTGIRFREGFAEEQTRLLKKNEAQLRTQASLLFPCVAIMKSLMREKLRPGDALERLNFLMNAEVPRFSGCVMLMALALLLKARQPLKLEGDNKPAYSFLESFLAFQPEKKDETDRICIRYLRNRAGDLSLWYVMPALLQHGYRFVGEPVVVTGDKALHRVILRVIPPVAHESRVAAFTAPPGEIEDFVRSEILRIATEWKPPQPRTSDERSRLMKKLFELAADCCEFDEEKEALMVAWSEWFLPGEGLPMKF